MTPELTVAAVQLTSTQDVDASLSRSIELARAAVEAGARFVALPENYGFLGRDVDKLKHAQSVETGPFIVPLRELANEYDVYILAGSIPETGPDERHTYNTSVVIGPDGETVSTYRKIHMFDVDLADGTSLKESDSVAPGDGQVVTEIDGWKVGLTICYDLRFPELYRLLSQEGADLFTVPAAFTLHTGKDHWDVLLRARAIENQCFVLAPDQFGHHGNKRSSWGKSQVIDPWGAQLAVAPDREGFAIATLVAEDLLRVRGQLPCAAHRRL